MRTTAAAEAAATTLRHGSPLEQVQGGWQGGRGDGPVFVSTEFQGAWQVEGSEEAPTTAFGWATGFESQQAPVTVRYGSQLPATIQAWLLAAIWVVALWVTRKPVAR
jgi:hypothetical protein